jgi:hypothetical protein
LASGVPVMQSSQAAATTIYYTPYVGNQIPIYDGAKFVMTPFAELSATTTDTTHQPNAIGASEVNDWYVWNDSGTLRLVHDIYWDSDTARRSGYDHTIINGIPVNAVAITNGPAIGRGTYIGTTRSDASGNLNFVFGSAGSGGVAAQLMVWSAFNRVPFGTTVVDNASFTSTSSTIQQFHNGSTGMQVEFVLGAQIEPVEWKMATEANLAATNGSFALIAAGFDDTTAFYGQRGSLRNPGSAMVLSGAPLSIGSFGNWKAPIGRHVLSMNQKSDGAANEFNNASTATLSASLWL